MITLDKLIFDTANTAESANIGSYVRAGDDGTLIGHVSDALKVNLSNTSIDVTATDLDIRDLAFATDKVDASGSEVSLDAATLAALETVNAVQSGVWDIGTVTTLTGITNDVSIDDGGNSITVDAADLDIRDLINTQDSIAIGDETNLVDLEINDAAFVGGYGFSMYGVRQDAAGSPVSADGDAHPFVFNNDGELKVAADLSSSVADDAADSGNPIKVGGRGVSGALSALSASGDRFDLLGDLYRRVYVNTSPNVASQTSVVAASSTAAEIAATPLPGRRKIMVQNLGTKDVYLGEDNGVTTANGIFLPRGSSMEMEYGPDLNLWAITDSGTADLRILEAA